MEKEKWKDERDCISAYEKHSVNYNSFKKMQFAYTEIFQTLNFGAPNMEG